MLVQLLQKGKDPINESMTKSCYSIVDVCTGVIDEKEMDETTNHSISNDFALKCKIQTMETNHKEIIFVSKRMMKYVITWYLERAQ